MAVCIFPISFKASWRKVTIFVFLNRATVYDLTDEYIIFFIMREEDRMSPFSVVSS